MALKFAKPLKKSKNLLFTNASSDLYGASRIFLNTILLAQKAGHQPFVVLTSPGTLVDELRSHGIPVRILQLGILRRKYMSLGGLINRFYVITKAFLQLVRFIRTHNIHLVYSNACGIFAPALAAKVTGVSHLFHVHEVIENPRVMGKFTAKFMKWFASEVIVVSEAVKQSWLVYDKKLKIKVIYNGLVYDDFLHEKEDLRQELNIADQEFIIGMIARVHFWKGQTYFLEIARHLLDLGVKARFIMVGDAFSGYEYLYDEISQKKQALQLEDHVLDLGYRADIPKVMNTLNLLILPSTNPDPLPTVILEAMASGLPVVATAHGGAQEMIAEGETGSLIPWDNSVEAAQIISRLSAGALSWEEMGGKGRKRALEAFSLASYEENILKVISAY